MLFAPAATDAAERRRSKKLGKKNCYAHSGSNLCMKKCKKNTWSKTKVKHGKPYEIKLKRF